MRNYTLLGFRADGICEHADHSGVPVVSCKIRGRSATGVDNSRACLDRQKIAHDISLTLGGRELNWLKVPRKETPPVHIHFGKDKRAQNLKMTVTSCRVYCTPHNFRDLPRIRARLAVQKHLRDTGPVVVARNEQRGVEVNAPTQSRCAEDPAHFAGTPLLRRVPELPIRLFARFHSHARSGQATRFSL
jgi:hypothetical protein